MNTKRLRLLPIGLRFDGLMAIGQRQLVQLTEHDASAASHGATFYLPLVGITLEAIAQRRAQKRSEFATAGRSL